MSALAVSPGLGQLVLHSTRGPTVAVDQQLIDGTLQRTIDGASTVELVAHDPKRTLLQNPMFVRPGGLGYVDFQLDSIWFRLVKFEKQADDMTLTFEDRAVAYLRQHAGPKKATRGKVTRAEFALSLVREVTQGGGIGFYSPELHTVQPIENKRQVKTKAQKATTRDKGIPLVTRLEVRHADGNLSVATPNQIQMANLVLDVAASLNAGHTARLALIEACMIESSLSNLSGGDKDSRGILQVRDSTAAPMHINNRDVSACANAFLTRGFYTDKQLGGGGAIAIARNHPEAASGSVAQACQGSGYPDRYERARGEAQTFLDAYDGGVVDPTAAGTTATTHKVKKAKPFQFRRGDINGVPENSWDCLTRLASEVNWRCFCDRNIVYFISDDTLMQAAPDLVAAESDLGVAGIDFDVDRGKSNITGTLTARADLWAAGPGAVVELQEVGPANGRWLIETIRRPLWDPNTEITLTAPGEATAEPAPETTTVTVPNSIPAGAGGSRKTRYVPGSDIYKAYRAAWAINDHRYPYSWGGGHAHAGTPSLPTGSDPSGPPGPVGPVGAAQVGYDCSGAVGAVLAAAGWGIKRGGPVPVSGVLAASWGQAGVGNDLTVWANDSHAFIVFKDPSGSGDDLHFGTGDWGKGWDGAGFNPQMHPTDGFTARHWPTSADSEVPAGPDLRKITQDPWAGVLP